MVRFIVFMYCSLKYCDLPQKVKTLHFFVQKLAYVKKKKYFCTAKVKATKTEIHYGNSNTTIN